MSNFQTFSKVLAFATSSAENFKARKNEATLLKKSQLFRTQFPEKWEKRQEKIKIRNEEAVGIFRVSPFIKSLYAEQSAQIAERHRQNEMKKNMPRRIKISIQYSLTPSKKDKEENRSQKHYSVYRSKAEKHDSGLFDSLKHVVTHDDVDSRPELRVTVEGCQYLHNGIDDMDERSEKCRVKAHIFPDCMEHSHNMETDHRYIAPCGMTRWHHNFIFSGFVPVQYHQRHIVLTVSGRKHSNKMCLGQVVISGKNAFIKSGEGHHRTPTSDEILPLQKAVENPGNIYTHMLNLKPSHIHLPDNTRINIDIKMDLKHSPLFKGAKFKKKKDVDKKKTKEDKI